ncbi:MAG TPA: Calx-beta domain-containing protein [Candidatus Angelobacter sp.]|nr:Calx-beta domain-containing protein [Candidatus Angelobacter sp.]
MRRLRAKFFVPGRRSLFGLAVMAFVALGVTQALAQPAPANDNFASATVLDPSAMWGSVSNSSTGATSELGEPTHAGFAPTATVWYKWTAPADGEVEVDTIGTTFDTVLAVYTGNSVGSLAQVAANDDLFITFPEPGLGQLAQENDMLLPVDNTNIPPSPGTLLLGPTDPIPPLPFGNGSQIVNQPFIGYPLITTPFSGASGLRFNAKLGVTYYFVVGGKFTGGFPPNTGPYRLNWAFHSAGVFRFASETRDSGSGVSGMLLYQAAESESTGFRSGLAPNLATTENSVYNFAVPGVLVTVTRVAGSSGQVTIGYKTVDGNMLSSHYSYDTNSGILTGDGNPLSLGGDAPAIGGVDYTPVSGTLTFNDFEMSKTIVIPIQDDLGVAQPNRDFGIVLFNPQLGPSENPIVSQPRLDPVDSVALVRILDLDIDPRGPAVGFSVVTNIDPNAGTTNVFTNTEYSLQSSNAMFNFMKTDYRIPEDISDYYTSGGRNAQITIYVNRSGTNQDAASCFYRINTEPLDDQSTAIGANVFFPLQPGSDYATPTPVNDAKVLGRDPSDFSGSESGTLTWGSKDFDPKPITFTINNDNIPEFNEDFRITLYDLEGDPKHPVPVGMVGEATVTIMFDDNDPPAGSVDEYYNPDFSLDIIPPVNGNLVGATPRETPGTEFGSQVNALVVQPDNMTIIGGNFATYNSASRHGIARIDTSGELDTTFDPGDGINITGGDFVSALAVQPDGKVLVAGSFTSFNGQFCGNIIRLNPDGSVDSSFREATGTGANGIVRSIFLRGDGKIILGGDFTFFNGTARNYIARLNPDGTVDTTYTSGNALNGPVYALGPLPPTSTLISTNGADPEYTNIVNVGAPAGQVTLDFTNQTAPNEVRVYYGSVATGALIYDSGLIGGAGEVVIPFGPTNGLTLNTVEIVVNPGNGTPGVAWTMAANVQSFGGDLLAVGGDFTAAGGVLGQDHIARLLINGSLDTTFDPGSGANGRVRALAMQSDGKVILGGDFTSVNGQALGHIARLNTDGTVDNGFFCGTGTDGGVYHLHYIPAGIITNTVAGNQVFTTNNDMIYVGGPFSIYNGTHRLGFARLNADGSLDTSFLDTAYNQFAGLPRLNFGDRLNAVFASDVQTDGNVMIGGFFSQVGGGQFDVNERPEPLNPWAYTEPKQRDGVRNRFNVARLIGGSTPGPGNIGLANSSYPASKLQGFIYGLLTRTNGSLGYGSANFSVVPISAQPVQDFTYYAMAPIYPIQWQYWGQIFGTDTRMHSDGLWGTNTVMNDSFGNQWSLGINGAQSVLVGVNSGATGNANAQFQLSNPGGVDQFYLGGENIPLGVALGRTFAPFNIVDDTKKPGTFGFTAPTYIGSVSGVISVMRTNAQDLGPVSVDYFTSAGSNTIAGVDYTDTSGTLTFANGEVVKTFNVQITQSNYISSIEKTVNLNLTHFPVGAQIGLSNAVLRIINPNFQGFLNFDSTNYVTNLNAGAVQVTVNRNVGDKGTLDIQVVTSNGTAVAGTDFVNTTATLHWNSGDATSRTVTIPLINNGLLGGAKTFYLSLVNPLLNGTSDSMILGTATNATVTIDNDNNYGIYQLSAPSYVVNEATNGFATITVTRTSSSLGNATVNFATSDGSAVAGANYVATNGTLTFAPGQLAASFTVGIKDDGVTNVQPFFFNVTLSNPSGGALLGSPATAQVDILDAQSFNRPPGNGDVTFNQQGLNGSVLAISLQPDGKIIAGGNFTTVNGLPRSHVARFNSDGTLDTIFMSGLSGADGSVFSAAVQGDGNILVGGSFTTVDGVARTRMARLAVDGTLDTTFNPGAGADNSVFAIAEASTNSSGLIYAGGAFTTFGGAAHPGIVRLANNGVPDPSFLSTGVNGTVYAIAVYPENSIYAGKVLIGGSFTTVNGVNQTNVARLNADGSLDTNFVVDADGIVRALAIQNDDAALLGGEFLNVNGISSVRVARVSGNGTVDTAFAAALAPSFSDTVDSIAIQSDNRIVVGGQFLTANGVTRPHITRLMPTGATDPMINFGDGANGDVDVVVIQPADQMILIGGGFTQYNDQPQPYLARIYGGSDTGSGAFEFTSPVYQVNEDGLQAAITIRRTGGSSGPNLDGSGNVSVQFSTTPDTAGPNTNYITVVTNVSFPPGEVLEQVFVPILDDKVITTNKTVDLSLSNPSPGTELGDQTNAVLTIINTDSTISFSSPAFQVAKNVPTGFATITLSRQGGIGNSETVGFATTTNGTALIGTDYTPTNAIVTFNPGDISKTVLVGITNNGLVEGDQTVTMVISNILNATIADPSNAVLTIKDTTFAPGKLSFATTNFFANEGDPGAVVTVVRTGGSSGSISTFYYTTPGTGLPGLNYISVSNSLTFSDGQTNRSFTIPLVDNSVAQGMVNFGVSLVTDAGSGTTLASPSNAMVFINDNDNGFAFQNQTNTVRETAGQVSVNVIRIGATNVSSSVNYAMADGTAVSGANYIGSSGSLTFGPGQTLKSIVVPIVDDPQVTGDLFFTVALSTNASSLGSQLAFPSTNTIIIQDADAGISFTNTSIVVRRDAGQALITVVCNNPSVEPPIIDSNTVPLSVQYATADGTAVAGVDYLATSGTLVFTNGNGTNTFIVPIINKVSAQGERDFSIHLQNPTGPGHLVAPSNQVVQIIDATSGFKFSKATYSVNKTDGLATINVFRSGLTNSLATVDFLATNGTAIDGVHYFATNGTLVFTNGVTNQSFSVQIIDTTVVQPNKTVLLELLSPSNSILSAPSAATLTIHDTSGSAVIPAGAALVSESGAGAPNDVIDSNETVTVLFGFRDAGGLNVGNLIATLNAGGGVTPSPTPATQTYGPLVANSHSVSRPFTFTAMGTNGQQIVATFQLQDNTTNIGTAVFGFQLGSATTTFTNGSTIIINDHAIASPYPSTINVSNLVGQVLKATITLTNLAHGSPQDIDGLLVAPDQHDTLFMAHAGGQNSITNVNLTFDDAAGTSLPQSGQITSGTNKPTAYLPVPVFP